MVPFSFADHAFAAMPEGTLFWPARRALLVADLHFEKGSWFAKQGQMLPPYDSFATLAALEAIVARCDPAEIWCLGDSFHDAGGCERLPAAVQAGLRTMTAARRFVWITGNHDAALTSARGTAVVDRCGGEVMAEARIGNLVLRHEADPHERRPELSGHWHPKLRVAVRGRLVARRCFVASPTKLVLPAFGALTGGLDATHPDLMRAVGGRAHALVTAGDRLLRFPLAA
jgi:uncharacterized protein